MLGLPAAAVSSADPRVDLLLELVGSGLRLLVGVHVAMLRWHSAMVGAIQAACEDILAAPADRCLTSKPHAELWVVRLVPNHVEAITVVPCGESTPCAARGEKHGVRCTAAGLS